MSFLGAHAAAAPKRQHKKIIHQKVKKINAKYNPKALNSASDFKIWKARHPSGKSFSKKFTI